MQPYDEFSMLADNAAEAGLAFLPLVTAPDLGFPYEGP